MSSPPLQALVERFLKHGCDPSLLREYERGDKIHRARFALAFKNALSTMYEDKYHSVGEEEPYLHFLRRTRPLSNDSVDPFEQLFLLLSREHYNKRVYFQEIVDVLKQAVERWTVPNPVSASDHVQYEMYLRMCMQTERDDFRKIGERRDYGMYATLHRNTCPGVRKQEPSDLLSASLGFRSLKKIVLADLRLFSVQQNCVLELEVISEPLVRVGLDIIVRDETGAVAALALYNCLPFQDFRDTPDTEMFSEINGVARRRFGVGAKIAICHPFLKLTVGGRCMIRVDSPWEVKVLSRPRGAGPGISDVSEARLVGNQAVKLERFTIAHIEYKSCFEDESVAQFAETLLSRAQLSLVKGGPRMAVDSLLDASAALTLRPELAAAWELYAAALTVLGHSDLAAAVENRQLTLLKDSEKKESESSADVTMGDASSARFTDSTRAVMKLAIERLIELLSQDGPQSNQESGAAAEWEPPPVVPSCVTAALSDLDTRLADLLRQHPLAAVLSNLALACISLDRQYEAFGFALSALRLALPHSGVTARTDLQPDLGLPTKAWFRAWKALIALGEFPHFEELARRALAGRTPGADADLHGLFLANNRPFDGNFTGMHRRHRDHGDKFLMYDWVSSRLQPQRICPRKGRGVFAAERIEQGELLMVCKEEACVRAYEVSPERCRLICFATTGLQNGSHCNLLSHLLHRVAGDASFARRLALLCVAENGADYPEAKLSTLSFETEFLDRIPPIALPCLPPGAEFATEQVLCSESFVEAVLDANAWGTDGGELVNLRPLCDQFQQYVVDSNLNVSGSGAADEIHRLYQNFMSERKKRQNQKQTQESRMPIPVSLINHHDKENVQQYRMNYRGQRHMNTTMLIADRALNPGEEICLTYSRDNTVLERKWGVKPEASSAADLSPGGRRCVN